MAVLLVAHDVNPILGFIDQVVYVAGGSAVGGRPQEVITSETLSEPVRRADRGAARLGRAARRRRPARGAVPPRRPPRPWLRPPSPMVDAGVFQGLSWNLLDDFRQLFAYPFMVNALEAGAIVAVMAGVTGWFMVLRRQAFAGHTLSVIAFPGAAAAGWAGVPLAFGYFGFCGARGADPGRDRRHAPEPRGRVGGDRVAAGAGPGPRLPVRLALAPHPDRARLAALRDLPRDHQVTSSRAPARGSRHRHRDRRGGAAALLRLGRRRSRQGERRAGPRARPRLPARARPLGGRDEPDHGCPARLRAARRLRPRPRTG